MVENSPEKPSRSRNGAADLQGSVSADTLGEVVRSVDEVLWEAATTVRLIGWTLQSPDALGYAQEMEHTRHVLWAVGRAAHKGILASAKDCHRSAGSDTVPPGEIDEIEQTW